MNARNVFAAAGIGALFFGALQLGRELGGALRRRVARPVPPPFCPNDDCLLSSHHDGPCALRERHPSPDDREATPS